MIRSRISRNQWRFERCLTALCLERDKVPFKLVIERQEMKEYAGRFGEERILLLPFQDRGLIAARNWIKDHAKSSGAERHWQLDDNMLHFDTPLKLKPGIRLGTGANEYGLDLVVDQKIKSKSLQKFAAKHAKL
jgi:hypothetical protein